MSQDNEITVALGIEAKIDDRTIEGGVDMVTDGAGQIDAVVARKAILGIKPRVFTKHLSENNLV